MDAIIIIPVYQPEKCVQTLVDKLWNFGIYIIIVDDGSDEEGQQYLCQLSEKAIILRHGQNRGKGAAIKTALSYIKENVWGYHTIGIMDGDGQHQPKDVERLIFKSNSVRNSLILGVRQIGKKMPLRSRVGNKVTRGTFRMLSGVYVSDTQSGLRVFDRQLLETFLKVPGNRYEYETGVLFQCAREHIPIVEVPIQTIYKDSENSTSHFRTIRDSLRV